MRGAPPLHDKFQGHGRAKGVDIIEYDFCCCCFSNFFPSEIQGVIYRCLCAENMREGLPLERGSGARASGESKRIPVALLRGAGEVGGGGGGLPHCINQQRRKRLVVVGIDLEGGGGKGCVRREGKERGEGEEREDKRGEREDREEKGEGVVRRGGR